MRQYLVSDLLHEGAENGTTLTELVQLTGEDERSIRRRIQRERKSGKLILSDNQSGYFLPGTEDEVKRFIRSMSRRAREISVVACVAEDALARMMGQESLEGWQNLQRPQRPEEGHAAACQHRAQRTSWTAGRCS